MKPQDTRLPLHFWTKVRIGSVSVHRPDLGFCWEWIGAKNKNNYGLFRAGSRTDGSSKTVSAHRFAYEALINLIPQELESDHLCRNRSCVNPIHIELVTHAVNIQRGDHGGSNRVKGEGRSNSKLKTANIYIIRSLRNYVSQRVLAKQFGVSQYQISRIQRNKQWAHVGNQL